VGEKQAVECLRCGSFRTVERERSQRLDPGECPKCGYLGWALFTDLTEATRRLLRERPPERRADQRPHLHAI
jgi:DNA-directed RNA polymerase subunit RPC12/RpoP